MPEDPIDARSLRKKRADRRAHLARMRGRAASLARTLRIPKEWRSLWVKKNANHLKMCSCWMCGHFRDSEGPPVSERRRMARERDPE